MNFLNRLTLIPILTFFFGMHLTFAQSPLDYPNTKTEQFLGIIDANNNAERNRRIKIVDQNWSSGDEIFLMETLYFSQNESYAHKLVELLQQKTGKKFGYDFDQWFPYIWNKPQNYPDSYFGFKAELHRRIDSKFYTYFLQRHDQSEIRLDEVRWGGVPQDGIPPLRQPKMIAAEEANYLRDTDVVFGIAVNGDVRAYPKRILAWHEMFVDEVGGVNVAGVYCTLCGTVILYKTEFEGVNHQLGTSGFLYRSNKLMYDKATQSLWSTLEGTPVIGPLVGKGIQLDFLSVVTTTWGEWKERHPQTQVLSLDTGHRRNYGEGVAYQRYFATDELMFTIPKIDTRLKNKDEILAIRNPKETEENLAISSAFLRENPIYQGKLAGVNFTVFTDLSGAHRVYKTKDLDFTAYDGKSTATSSDGTRWTLQENSLTGENKEVCERFPSHNAFWFGYQAAYPKTQLIR